VRTEFVSFGIGAAKVFDPAGESGRIRASPTDLRLPGTMGRFGVEVLFRFEQEVSAAQEISEWDLALAGEIERLLPVIISVASVESEDDVTPRA